jgi:hypothetical protein
MIVLEIKEQISLYFDETLIIIVSAVKIPSIHGAPILKLYEPLL